MGEPKVSKRPPGFTVLSRGEFPSTFVGHCIPIADRLRDILTKVGLRPYIVRLVWTQWTGSVGLRGRGVEENLREQMLLPTPKIAPLSELDASSQVVGDTEIGDLMLTQISGRYSEDFLSGRGSDGAAIPKDQNFFYEIEFPDADGRFPGIRRKFTLSSAPTLRAGGLQWQVQLTKALPNRARGTARPTD